MAEVSFFTIGQSQTFGYEKIWSLYQIKILKFLGNNLDQTYVGLFKTKALSFYYSVNPSYKAFQMFSAAKVVFRTKTENLLLWPNPSAFDHSLLPAQNMSKDQT